MSGWRPALVVTGLGLLLALVTLFAPREPPHVHLLAHPNGVWLGEALTVRAPRCDTLLAVPIGPEPSSGAASAWRYDACAPRAALDDDWGVDVSYTREVDWRVSGVEAACPRGRTCRVHVGPWQSAAVVAVDERGAPVGRPALLVGNQRRGINLTVGDVLRLVVVVALGAAAVLLLGAPRWWRGARGEVALVAAGGVVGLLLAGRPEAWGGAGDAGGAAAAVFVGAGWIGASRVVGLLRAGPIGRALGLLVVVVAVGAIDTALRHGRLPAARELERAVIVASALWTALSATTTRGAANGWLVATLLGLAATTLEALARPAMPLPGLHGVYAPWEPVSTAWAAAAVAPLLVRARAVVGRPARWTRDLAAPLVAAAGAPTGDERSRLEAALAPLRGRRLRVPNRATAAVAFTLERLMPGRVTTQPRLSIPRASAPLLLIGEGGEGVLGRVVVCAEPRLALLPDERALAVHDGAHAASPTLVHAAHAVLDAVDRRLGMPALALELATVRLEHPGDELVGRSFELPLALAWYRLRTGRAPRLEVLASGRLGLDREALAPVEAARDKLAAIAPGRILLVPGEHARELAGADVELVTLPLAPASTWRARRRARAAAQRGARVVVACPTLGAALSFVFGPPGERDAAWTVRQGDAG